MGVKVCFQAVSPLTKQEVSNAETEPKLFVNLVKISFKVLYL